MPIILFAALVFSLVVYDNSREDKHHARISEICYSYEEGKLSRKQAEIQINAEMKKTSDLDETCFNLAF